VMGGGVYDGCKMWRCFVVSHGEVVGMKGEQLENDISRTGLMLGVFRHLIGEIDA
jgi:hypothetical protein